MIKGNLRLVFVEVEWERPIASDIAALLENFDFISSYPVPVNFNAALHDIELFFFIYWRSIDSQKDVSFYVAFY